MLRYAKYAVPFLLKAPRRSPVKALAGVAAAYLMLSVGVLLVVVAAFIWTFKNYGSDIAFLATGLFFIALSASFLIWSKSRKRLKAAMPTNINQDPLANYIPETLKDSPLIQKLLIHISENPIAATATAATLGILLSKEFLEELN